MKRYRYNPEKRQLVFLSAKGGPVFGLAGPIAEKVHQRMQQSELKINPKTQ
ncbi:hypothetical protein [Flagellimonas onchidii]|uniref:hypothetical protein n=1 Tax=Flagellimonas onchidii TaxID=2562684 RepID=UPI0014560398|nr:hypothetical protein [Allomuricauda onchidii]